jgi:hypothetical protein
MFEELRKLDNPWYSLGDYIKPFNKTLTASQVDHKVQFNYGMMRFVGRDPKGLRCWYPIEKIVIDLGDKDILSGTIHWPAVQALGPEDVVNICCPMNHIVVADGNVTLYTLEYVSIDPDQFSSETPFQARRSDIASALKARIGDYAKMKGL